MCLQRPPSQSWSWQHLLLASRWGGCVLGVSHHPAMKPESHRVGSPGSPPSRSHKDSFEKSSPPPTPALRLSAGGLWGQGPTGLPPGAQPGSQRRQPVSTMSVKSHRGQPGFPREGGFQAA